MKEYDIFLPLEFNDGKPVEPSKFAAVKQRLLAKFGGVTFFPQANEGARESGDVVYNDHIVIYNDHIVIYRVLAPEAESAREFLARLKGDLKEEFQQKAILIIERDVDIL